MGRDGEIGGESDAVARRAGVDVEPPSAARAEEPRPVPRDVPADDSNLPEELRDSATAEPAEPAEPDADTDVGPTA